MRRGIYDPNRASNGVALPMTDAESRASGKPLHSGRHLRSYYDHVRGKLDVQEAKLIGKYGSLSSVPDAELMSKIGAVERGVHMDLNADRVRLQKTDTRPPGTRSSC
jgi:A nuclease family of the HNH/ENDO VII superfamily with conserved AHH